MTSSITDAMVEAVEQIFARMGRHNCATRPMIRAALEAALPSALASAEAKGFAAPYGIYVASRARHAAVWKEHRAKGVPIISTWIDEAGEGETADLSELWSRVQREINSAERLVLLAEAKDFPLKGALIEVGMALALRVPVYVVLHHDIELDPRSLRPLGSWLNHLGVMRVPNLYAAFRAMRPTTAPAASEPFDITDGRNRYQPCPRCGATLNMGLCHRGDMLAVECGFCRFRGPEVAGRVSIQKDRCAFNAWNVLALGQRK